MKVTGSSDVNVLQAKRERHGVARPDHVIVHLHNDVRVFVGIKGGETEDDPLLFQVWRVQHDEFSVIGVVGHRQGDEHGVRAVLVDRARVTDVLSIWNFPFMMSAE